MRPGNDFTAANTVVMAVTNRQVMISKTAGMQTGPLVSNG